MEFLIYMLVLAALAAATPLLLMLLYGVLYLFPSARRMMEPPSAPTADGAA